MPPFEPHDEQRAPDLRPLKWLALLLPVAGVAAGEILRGTLIDPNVPDPTLSHLVAGTVAAGAVVVFTGLMFFALERMQRRVLQQNRALRIANAVSVAVQGERPLEEVIDRALATVLESTGALDASVTVFGTASTEGSVHRAHGRRPLAPATADGRPAATTASAGPAPVAIPGTSADEPIPAVATPGGPVATPTAPPASGLARASGLATASALAPAGLGAPFLIDLPLASGTSLVGRLRLEMSAEPEPGAIPERVLQNISHQLASAIQMGQLIGDLRRRRREAAALYEVALQVTSRYALADILGSIVRHARELLEVDEAVICLSDPASQAVRDARLVAIENVAADGAVCFSPGDDPISMRHDGARPGYCPVRSSPAWGAAAEAPLRSAEASLGSLWVARRAPEPINESGRALLAGLADLAAIAIVSARLRESERQAAILAERERIAREMHDSLAQVLATNHLRLRSLEEKPEIQSLPDVASEIAVLGDLTHDAYRDVREAILGLRESSRSDRHLLESLRIYVDKYSRQSGITTTLETTADDDLGLPLATEIQVIRVIQEALTNVRKHAGARHATVLVKPDDSGVTLSVEDDGHGFDPASELVNREDSFGLRGMRERMELVGGTLSVHSAPGRGTRVTARVLRPALPTPRRIEEPRAERESHANLAR